MGPFTKKILGLGALLLGFIFEGFLLAATVMGLADLPKDAREKLPVLTKWLIGAPPWVCAVGLVALFTFAFFVFAPDRSAQKAMREYRKSNEKAWAFEPEFRDVLDKLSGSNAALRHDLEAEIKINRDRMAEIEDLALAKINIEIERGVAQRLISNSYEISANALSGKLEEVIENFDKLLSDYTGRHQTAVSGLESQLSQVGQECESLRRRLEEMASSTSSQPE